MRIRHLALLLLILISLDLSACHSVGNVVPKTGPTMEQVYDNMGHDKKNTDAETNNHENDLKALRQEASKISNVKASLPEIVPESQLRGTFHKVSNPMLHLYVYPHLAGQEELPVPGYTTAFNVYDKDHFTLLKN